MSDNQFIIFAVATLVFVIFVGSRVADVAAARLTAPAACAQVAR